MPKKHNYYYCACSNDEFELTWFSGDTFEQLLDWLHAMGDTVSAGTLIASPTGIAVTYRKMYKVMRVNKRSGKILVGKLPDTKNKNH